MADYQVSGKESILNFFNSALATIWIGVERAKMVVVFSCSVC